MGPSGAGKSTLLDCLAGLRKNGLTGDVIFAGGDRVKLAFIPQKVF